MKITYKKSNLLLSTILASSFFIPATTFASDPSMLEKLPPELQREIGKYKGSLEALEGKNIKASELTEENVETYKLLKDLRLHIDRTDDETMKLINQLSNLEFLNLSGPDITDADFQKVIQNLKGLNNIKTLSLYGSQITDAGLENVKELKNLQNLQLNTTFITDAGLEHLKGLKNLQFINLHLTKVTDAGVSDLQKSLPNVKINR